MSDTTIVTGITNAGLSIIAQSQLGETVTITKIKIGDGTLPSGQDPAELNDLINALDTLNIYSSEIIDNTTIKVTALVLQASTGYYFREIGLFAIDPETNQEVLYAYGNKGASATYIPSNQSNLTVEEQATILTEVGNSTTTIINYSTSFTQEFTYTAQVGTAWIGDSAPYSQEVAVAGMLATDNPQMGLVQSGTYQNKQDEQGEYSKIFDGDAGTDKVTLYADEPTTKTLNIQLKVVR